MKRVEKFDKHEGEEKIWWRNHGGIHRIREGKKIIKPNEKFLAYPSEIPKQFRDKLRPIDGDEVLLKKEEEKENKAKTSTSKTFFEAVHKGGGYYNVINSETQKVINEKPLKADEAQKLLKELSEK